MIYCFDLDGVLCSDEKNVYEAKPLLERIKEVNKLYDQGHTILIDTARGTRTGKQHQEMTENQIKKWGIKYTLLRTGMKFFADCYIDDRGLSDKQFFK